MADIWTAKLFPRDSANRFVVQRSALQVVRGRVQQERAVGQTRHQPRHRDRQRRGERGRHVLPREPLDRQAHRHRRPALPRHPAPVRQCHNHPFTSWKQTEYWGMAAFFSKVQADNPKNANKGGDNTKIGVQENNARTKREGLLPRVGQDGAGEVPRRPAAATEPERAVPAGAREVDDRAGEPVLRAGAGQSHLGASVRPRVRQPGRRHDDQRTSRATRNCSTRSPGTSPDRRVRREVPRQGDLSQRDLPAHEQAERRRTSRMSSCSAT